MAHCCCIIRPLPSRMRRQEERTEKCSDNNWSKIEYVRFGRHSIGDWMQTQKKNRVEAVANAGCECRTKDGIKFSRLLRYTIIRIRLWTVNVARHDCSAVTNACTICAIDICRRQHDRCNADAWMRFSHIARHIDSIYYHFICIASISRANRLDTMHYAIWRSLTLSPSSRTGNIDYEIIDLYPSAAIAVRHRCSYRNIAHFRMHSICMGLMAAVHWMGRTVQTNCTCNINRNKQRNTMW